MLKAIWKYLFWERESFPDTFAGELNYQSNLVIVPASIICIFAWLGYIAPDGILHPDRPLIMHLRWGLSAVSCVILVIQFIPRFKRNSMVLLAILGFYIETATGLLTGLTGGDPVYMAGYFYVLMLIIIAPVYRWILWLMSATSVAGFFTAGYYNGLSFVTPQQKYTLNDFVSLIVFTAVFTYILDRIRLKGWQKSSELKRRRAEIEREKDQISAIMAEAKELIEHIRGTTDSLSTFSGEINASIEEQSPVVSQTMASSSNVIDSFQTINANTEKQVDLNRRGIALVSTLRQEFGETMSSSDSVRKDAAMTGDLAYRCQGKLDNASTTITALKDESSRIAEISKTINDIADMTALLSLNASIESARAGEHGRGFAVVADEISKLADDSMSSAKEIGDIIRMSVTRIAEASDQIIETADILKEIIAIMNENRNFLDRLRGMIETLGNNSRELMSYFDSSVNYTSMIDELTEKNSGEIRTYQAMMHKIKDFYSELDLMSDRLTDVSADVNNEISRLETVLAGAYGEPTGAAPAV